MQQQRHELSGIRYFSRADPPDHAAMIWAALIARAIRPSEIIKQ